MINLQRLNNLAFLPSHYDSFLVFGNINSLYFSGFAGAEALLLTRDGENVLFVKSVNYDYAISEVKNSKIQKIDLADELIFKIASEIENQKVRNVALDNLNYEDWRVLSNQTKRHAILKVESTFVPLLRAVKDDYEISRIRQASKLSNQAMAVAHELLKPGLRECDLAAEVEYAMRSNGSDGLAFNTIVASGPRAAFPHSACSDRKIASNDLVIVDLGATCKYYCSDMTRTFVCNPTDKQKRMVELVKQAHDCAIAVIKEGAIAKNVDAAARNLIQNAGYGKQFVHRLGHGVGLEIHEFPFLDPTTEYVLSVGNVVTVEPGIYIIGKGGVRIEDTVTLTNNGLEILTGEYMES